MAHKSSFDAEARKRAIDKAMPEDKPNLIMKTIRKGMTKFHEATTPPEELDALKRVKAKKAKARAEARAAERTKELDERIEKSSDKDSALYTKRRESSGGAHSGPEGMALAEKHLEQIDTQKQRKKEGDARIAELKEKGE